MRPKHLLLFGLTICLLIVASPAFAGKPGTGNPTQYLGNGFPSGPHFNLLIHGKDATFSCPQLVPEYYLVVIGDNNNDGDLGDYVKECDLGDSCTPTDKLIYGNVINIPRAQGEDPISILIESGKKMTAPGTIGLEVTDWCTESFPDDGSAAPPLGDKAVLRLEQNAYGYAVYARVLGKPGEDGGPTFEILPGLPTVVDGEGSTLALVGFVNSTGTYNASGALITRYESSGQGKGAISATDISPIFQFTGSVCYDTVQSQCCVDTDDPLDGWNRCDLLADVGIDGACPETDADGYDYTTIDSTCMDFQNMWVFNVADFVNVLYSINSTGVYNMQIRFYPLPLK